MAESLGVAEAKRRFSELIDRVIAGERFVISRHGKPAVTLVAPSEPVSDRPKPLGLASVAGALADWEDLPEAVENIYSTRRRAKDRTVPDLD